MKDLLRNKKILVVDDEQDILETLVELLSMCTVVKASTFKQGKELLEEESFDMAILDIMGVNGYKLLEIAKGKNIVAVMLTAHALSPDDTMKSYVEGADLYIPKEEVGNIAVFLNDVLEAKKKGKNPWWRWTERFDAYYNQRFGSDWKGEHKEFWENLISY
jgi:DNA-binding NtrC family response regulator